MPWRGSIIMLLGACAVIACDKNRSNDNSFSAQPVSNTNATLNAAQINKPSADISAADNASKVKRFNDEVPMAPTTMHLASSAVTIGSMPGGEEATVITRDGVTALAKRDDWYLVLYSDPSNTQKTLAGWVYKDSVVGPATHPSQ